MSGPLRQVIGPAKARLTSYLSEVKDPHPLVDDAESLPDQLRALGTLRAALVYENTRINRLTTLLDGKNSEWGRLLSSLDIDDQKEEEKLYDKTALGANGFLAVCTAAEEKLDLLQTWLSEVDATVASLRDMQRFPATAAASSSSSAHGGLPAQVTVSSNLLKVEPPVFDGDPLKWTEFWDCYDCTVHDQPISNVQKFTHLKKHVTGSAYDAIEGISVCNDNYDEAVEILTKRFGDKGLIKETLYSHLSKLPEVNKFRVGDLRRFVDNMEKYCRQLSAMGEDPDHHSLVGGIMEKLPGNIIIKLEEQYKPDGQSTWSLTDLREALGKLLDVQERVSRLSKLPQQTQQSSSRPRQASGFNRGFNRGFNQSNYRGYKGPSSTFPGGSNVDAYAVTSVEPQRGQQGLRKVQQPQPKSPCILCGGRHFNEHCAKYKTLDSRRGRLRELNRCCTCLREGCQQRQCPARALERRCFHCQKVGEHNRMLCPLLFPNKGGLASTSGATRSPAAQGTVKKEATPVHLKSATVESSVVTEDHPTEEVNVGKVENAAPCKKSAYLLTAQAFVSNGETRLQPTEIKLFMDCGSQKSFISNKLAAKLGLQPIQKETLSIYTFGGQKPCVVNSSVVCFQLFLKGGDTMAIEANAMDELTGAMRKGALSTEDQEYLKQFPPQCLAEPVITETQSVVPEVLIGEDYFWEILETSAKHHLPSGMYLLPSKLGLLLGGRYCDDGDNKQNHTITCTGLVSRTKDTTEFVPNLEDFWSLESIGIMDSYQLNDDDLALQQFNSSVQFQEGRYHVRWPWRSENPELPNNYGLAMGRLKSLFNNRLKKDDALLQKYDALLKEQLQKGIIEVVTEETGNLVHYLPHHPVVNPDRQTTKIRVVYDASAKQSAKHHSLNECQYSGPTLLPHIHGVLLRFRVPTIVLTADIEKAFLQVCLLPDQRDVTRFFWIKNIHKKSLDDNVITLRFCRVPFGVISSPFLLNATLKFHLQQCGTETAMKIAENIYVDNVIIGAETPEEAIDRYHEGKKIFSDATMNLREWTSNCEEFVKAIPESDQTNPEKAKVLGLIWDVKEDTIKLPESKAFRANPPTDAATKRQVLNCVASVYDPLGFAAPVTVEGKMYIPARAVEPEVGLGPADP